MSIQNPLENPNDIDLKPFSTKSVFFNTMWERDINGIRKLELDSFRSLNSNINAIYVAPQFVGSPIDGTTTKTSVTLFMVRKRLIKLMDIWNRILNSGLFNIQNLSNGATVKEIKIIGSNLPSILVEYPLKDFNSTNQILIPVVLDTPSIFYRIQRFLTAYTRNYDNFLITNLSVKSYFRLDNTTLTNANIEGCVNINHNPTKPSMMALIEELVTLYKGLLSETKIANAVDLGFTFNDLTFLTATGRANILKLDSYKSNYKAIAPIEPERFNYLNPETKVLVNDWISKSSNLDKLYPQFGTEIFRNEETEPWNYKNVIVDLAPFKNDSSFTQEHLGLDAAQLNRMKGDKYWVGSQLDMRKPLYFSTQFINWENADDQPYVMLYNGSTLVYLPDDVKDLAHPGTLNTLMEAPDNQLNLSANFWKIGTSNQLDPNYNPKDDIKLRIGSQQLHTIDKLDFFDNLNLFLKLN